MSKSSRAAPKAKTKKIPPVRTIQTRPRNAGVNPLDLEVQDSDDERTCNAAKKRKKKVKKTQEEQDAEDVKRGNALAAVSALELEMEQQAIDHQETPRISSTSRTLARDASYVVPDPPTPPPAKRSSRVSRIISSTEDDTEHEEPARMKKKTRFLREKVTKINDERKANNAGASHKPVFAAGEEYGMYDDFDEPMVSFFILSPRYCLTVLM